jgi:hypothetical protein
VDARRIRIWLPWMLQLKRMQDPEERSDEQTQARLARETCAFPLLCPSHLCLPPLFPLLRLCFSLLPGTFIRVARPGYTACSQGKKRSAMKGQRKREEKCVNQDKGICVLVCCFSAALLRKMTGIDAVWIPFFPSFSFFWALSSISTCGFEGKNGCVEKSMDICGHSYTEFEENPVSKKRQVPPSSTAEVDTAPIAHICTEIPSLRPRRCPRSTQER